MTEIICNEMEDQKKGIQSVYLGHCFTHPLSHLNPSLCPSSSVRGYQCRLEPRGSLLIPPDFNVGLTDWERSKRLRKGVFDVLEMEPHGGEGGQQPEAMGGAGGGKGHHSVASVAVHPSESHHPHHPHPHLARYQQPMSEGDLEAVKRKLERLLPSSPSEEGGGAF